MSALGAQEGSFVPVNLEDSVFSFSKEVKGHRKERNKVILNYFSFLSV